MQILPLLLVLLLVNILHNASASPTKAPTTHRADCVAGTIADALDECSATSAGFWSNAAGATAASRCPPSKYCAAGPTLIPAACAPGTTAPLSGMMECLPCSTGTETPLSDDVCASCTPGSFLSDSLSPPACALCAAGLYAATARSSACATCAPGFFAATTGRTACDACGGGTRSEAGAATGCVACAAGTRSSAAAGACVSCAPGRYSSGSATVCASCTSALFASAAATECWGCAAGKEPFATATVDGEQCKMCAAGRFRASLAMATVREDCAVPDGGRWASGSGATHSDACPAGSKCEGGVVTPCQLGRYAPIIGLSTCLACGAGGIASAASGATACSTCAAGRYQPGGEDGQGSSSSATSCHACIAGRFAEVDGSAACDPAPPGRFVDATSATRAILCPVGHECPGSAREAPLPCRRGTYAASEGHAACISCRLAASEGVYTTSAGASRCSTCERGKFAALTTQTACEMCVVGRFAAESIASACAECALGHHATSPGASACVACDVGKMLNVSDPSFSALSTCVECPVNTFATHTASTSCERCAAGESTLGREGALSCTRDALDCPPGTYLFDAKGDTSCTGCPKQGVLCVDNGLEVLSSFWFAPIGTGVQRIDDKVEVFACINDVSCVPPVPSVERDPRLGVLCEEGYTSVLCGACDLDLGFVRSGEGCVECWAMVLNVLVAVAMGVGLFCALLWVVAFKDFAPTIGEYHSVIFKMLMSYCQMLMVLGIFKARGTDMFNDLTQRPAEIVGGSLTSTFPIKCLLRSSLYRPFIINMSSPVLIAIATLLVIGPVWIYKVAARRKRAGLPLEHPPSLKRAAPPCCCRKRALTPWELKEWRAKRDAARERTFDPLMRFQSVLVFAMFSVYPTLVRSVASILRCTVPINGVQYLEDDLSIVCWKGNHWLYVVFGVLCGTFYLLGTPLAVVLLLSRNRFQLNEAKFRGTFSFLYNGYSTDRGVLVVSWEALVMLRKLAITAIAVSASDPYTQVLVALLLLILSYGMQEHFLPYETSLLNALESVGLFVLIFTQVLSILYLYIDSRAKASGKKDLLLEISVTVALTVCNGGIAVAMLFGIVYTYCATARVEKHAAIAFNEPSGGAWGDITPYRNPRIVEAVQWEYEVLVDIPITVLPEIGGERTGQLLERGATVFVNRRVDSFHRVGCCTVRRVSFLCLTGGQGWVIDRDPKTRLTQPTVKLEGCTVGNSGESGVFARKVWRFTVIARFVRVQTASLPWPYINYTGESLKKGESVVVDRFVERKAFTGSGCQRAVLTFLHLADGRGWVIEPSKLPLSARAKHKHASVLELKGTEMLVRSADRLAAAPVAEYSVDALAEVYEDCVWPGVLTGEVVLPHSNVLISQRAQMQVKGESKRQPGWRCWKKKPQLHPVATFLQLVDGRGWILLSNPITNERVSSFVAIREDSVDLATGRSTLCFLYRNMNTISLPILMEPSKHAKQCTDALPPDTGSKIAKSAGSAEQLAGAGSNEANAAAGAVVECKEAGVPKTAPPAGAAEAEGEEEEEEEDETTEKKKKKKEASFDGKLINIEIREGEGRLGLRLGVDPVTATVVVISISQTGMIGRLYRGKLEEGDHLYSIAGRRIESFDEMDEDGDNSISREEARHALERLRGVPPSEEELGELWERCDADGDGEVSLDEFTAVLAEWILDEAMAQMGSEARPYTLVFGRPRPIVVEVPIVETAAPAAAPKRTPRVMAPGADVLTSERVVVRGREYARICDVAAASSARTSMALHTRNMGWIATQALELVTVQIGARLGAERFDCTNRIWTYSVKTDAGCAVRTEPNVRAAPIVAKTLEAMRVHADDEGAAAEGDGETETTKGAAAAAAAAAVDAVPSPSISLQTTLQPPPLLIKGDLIVASKLLVKKTRRFHACFGASRGSDDEVDAVVFAQIRQVRRANQLIWASPRSPGWWCATVDTQTQDDVLELELEAAHFSSAVLIGEEDDMGQASVDVAAAAAATAGGGEAEATYAFPVDGGGAPLASPSSSSSVLRSKGGEVELAVLHNAPVPSPLTPPLASPVVPAGHHAHPARGERVLV